MWLRFGRPLRAIGSRPPRRFRRRLVVIVVFGLTVLAGAIALLGRPYDGELPPDVQVGGVAVGGQSDAAAAQLLASAARPVVSKGLVLTSGSEQFPVSLRKIKIAPDTADALRRARTSGSSTASASGSAWPSPAPSTCASAWTRRPWPGPCGRPARRSRCRPSRPA